MPMTRTLAALAALGVLATLCGCGEGAAALSLSLSNPQGIAGADFRAVRVRVFAPMRADTTTLGCSDFLNSGLSPFASVLGKLAEVTRPPGERVKLDLDPGPKLVYVEAYANPTGAGAVSAIGCGEANVSAGQHAQVDVVMVRAVDGDGDGHAGLIDFGGGQSAEGPDCNDADPQAHTGAVEACGGMVDLDCDRMLPPACGG
jgi:hypothetical protein